MLPLELLSCHLLRDNGILVAGYRHRCEGRERRITAESAEMHTGSAQGPVPSLRALRFHVQNLTGKRGRHSNA